MRSVRTFAVASFAITMLAACNPSSDDPSSTSPAVSTDPTTSSDSTDPVSAEIEVPEIENRKITSRGDLCDMIPVDVAAEVLDVPTFTSSNWNGAELNPDTVDACTFAYFDDMGTSDDADDVGLIVNVFILSNVDMEWFSQLRQSTIDSGREVTDYNIDGYDGAFYSLPESNIFKGDRVYAANITLRAPSEERIMAFLTMVADADS